MKKIGLALLSLLYSQCIVAQNIGSILEYQPAPGQYINTSLGNPAAAENLINNGMVSLGAYGGYLVIQTDKAIENDPNNPYGIDFTVFGNALSTWSEPAVVMVMQDQNSNGLADDTWYTLAGSDYHWSDAVHNYMLSYQNPQQTEAAPVPWKDNFGTEGLVPTNSFHTQPYYPTASNFPSIPQDFYFFQGECLNSHYDCGATPYSSSYPRAFGYADNIEKRTGATDNPDNPYTPDIEGCGGDAMDISWAVDENGSYVALEYINFIKIYTAVNDADKGVMGELSTEIKGIADVNPQTNWEGTTAFMHLKYFPPRLLQRTSFNLEALHFEMGIPADDQTITYTSDNEAVVSIDGQQLTAIAPGETRITAYLNSNPKLKSSRTVKVIAPSKITLEINPNTLYTGDTSTLIVNVLDQNNHNILPLPNLQWKSSNTNVASMNTHYDSIKIYAHNIGESYISAYPSLFPELKDSIKIVVRKKDYTENIEQEAFLCYPNPAEDYLYISPYTNFTIRIFNLQGQCVQEDHISNHIVDIRSLKQGVYQLQINAKGQTYYHKFIKK